MVSRGARCPRSALAKTAVLRTASFSFAPTSARLRCAMWEQMKNSPQRGLFLLVGAGGRTRTDTDFTPQDFESSASASFTTPAHSTSLALAQVFSGSRLCLSAETLFAACKTSRVLPLTERRDPFFGKTFSNVKKNGMLALANQLTSASCPHIMQA